MLNARKKFKKILSKFILEGNFSPSSEFKSTEFEIPNL